MVSRKKSSSTTVFNIYNKKEMFLEHQMNVLNMYYMTLKTGVMAAKKKNQLCHDVNKLHF